MTLDEELARMNQLLSIKDAEIERLKVYVVGLSKTVERKQNQLSSAQTGAGELLMALETIQTIAMETSVTVLHIAEIQNIASSALTAYKAKGQS